MSSFENFRPVRMRRFTMTWTRHVERFTRSVYGFEMPESRLVWLLGRSELITAKELCAPALMEKSQVSRSIAKLRALGLVEAQPNPTDLRSEYLQLTRSGRACFERMLSLSLKWADWVEADLTPEEQQVLEAVLAKLQLRVEQLGEVVESDVKRSLAGKRGGVAHEGAGMARKRQRLEGETRRSRRG
jgi:DNA-binding MarR family transcriptional regulator